MNKLLVCGPPSHWVPAHLSYARHLLDKLRAHGERTALVDAESGAECSYSSLLHQAVDLASGLRARGLSRGDIVAVCSENRIELAVTIVAVIFCGATVATASPVYTQLELTHVLNLSKPKYVFCSPKAFDAHMETLKNLTYIEDIFIFDSAHANLGFAFEDTTGIVEIVSKYTELRSYVGDVIAFQPTDVKGNIDVMLILSTAGTAGLPKAAIHTHLNCLLSYADSHDKYNVSEIETVVSFIPWHDAYGFTSTMEFLAMGKTLVYMTKYEEEMFYRTIQNYKVNLVLAAPFVLVDMCKSTILEKFDLTSIRRIFCSGEALNSETVRAVKEKIHTARSIVQGYVMAETFCVMHNAYNEEGTGGPTNGVQAKITDLKTGKLLGPNQSGEIWIKTICLMKGYMGDPTANKAVLDEDGFYKTGDFGYYTEDHMFYVVGRVKELIKYKGNQVAPAEVEEVLQQHPGVRECGVGAPDELAGELPTAFVVRCPGSKVTAEELQRLVAEQLSNPKRLRGGVRFVEELPRNPTGKLLRRVLKEK